MSILPRRFMSLRLAVAMAAFFAASVPQGLRAADEPSQSKNAVEDEDPETIGLSLGQYSLRDVRGAEGAKIRIDFSLYATFDSEKLKFSKRLLKQYENRVRDQVIMAVRLCDTKDFQEAELQRVKRRILLRLKRAAPKLEIQQLHFHEFTFFLD